MKAQATEETGSDPPVAPNPPGTWTPEMKDALKAQYAVARDAGTLRELAEVLGVGLYQLYAQAHRMGLARPIRRR